MTAPHHERVLIVDFGSQVTQLIARRVRESGVYCEIHPYDRVSGMLEAFDPKAVILSGGPASVPEAGSPRAPAERARLQLIVVLGAPQNPSHLYKGPWDLVYRTDPPGGHMDGPRALLATLH